MEYKSLFNLSKRVRRSSRVLPTSRNRSGQAGTLYGWQSSLVVKNQGGSKNIKARKLKLPGFRSSPIFPDGKNKYSQLMQNQKFLSNYRVNLHKKVLHWDNLDLKTDYLSEKNYYRYYIHNLPTLPALR